jgi:hypothetical protein
MNRFVEGTIAGIAGTAVMTGVMTLGKAQGWMGTSPPRKITVTAGRKIGVPTWAIPDSIEDIVSLAAHFGYGAACGLVFALARPLLPRNKVIAGLMFGEAIWGISYLGYLPALGLYPPPDEDTASRAGTMVAAHAAFGLTLSEAERLIATS